MAANWGRFAEGLVSGYQSERKARTEREEAALRMEEQRARMRAAEEQRKREFGERETVRRSGQFDLDGPDPNAKPSVTPAIPVAGAAPTPSAAPAAPMQSPIPAGAPAPAAPVLGGRGSASPPPGGPAIPAASAAGAPAAPPAAGPPPAPGAGGALPTAPVQTDMSQRLARIRSHQAEIDSIEDPNRRSAAQRNFDRSRLAAIAPLVAQANSAAAGSKMPEAVDFLNQAYAIATGRPGGYSVDQTSKDANGQPMPHIVDADGRVVSGQFMSQMAAVLGGDDVAALKALDQLRREQDEKDRNYGLKRDELTETSLHNRNTEANDARRNDITNQGNWLSYRASLASTAAGERNSKRSADATIESARLSYLARMLTDNEAGGGAGGTGGSGRAGKLDSKAVQELEAGVRSSLDDLPLEQSYGYTEERKADIVNIATQLSTYASSKGFGISPTQATSAGLMIDLAVNGAGLSPQAREMLEAKIGAKFQDLTLEYAAGTGEYVMRAGPTGARVLLSPELGGKVAEVLADRDLEAWNVSNPMGERSGPPLPARPDPRAHRRAPQQAIPAVRGGGWGAQP